MLLIYNGTIHTMDADHAGEGVMVGDDGRILSVGHVGNFPTSNDSLKMINLRGRTLIPGFNDAHVHIWKLGLRLTQQVDATLRAAPTIDALVQRFREKAAQTPPGAWLQGRGYNEAELPEGRHPTRHDLDLASAIHPIALTRTCGHMIVANSRALELAGITAETPDPPGGVVQRDEHGQPTGLLMETAMGLINAAIPDYTDAQMGDAIVAANAHQLSLGITSATDPLLTPFHLRVYRQLEAQRKLKVRVNGLPIRRPDGGTETLPLPERYVSETLRIDTVKFFADGGLSGATAAVSAPYLVTEDTGVLRFDTEDLTELMWEAHNSGFRIATHAIGDRAIEQVLGIYERLQTRDPRPDLRHRIEHFGLPNPEHFERAAALNVIVVPQTIFVSALGASFRRYLPPTYIERCYPVKDMLDAGLTVALSSDAPVVPDANPLLGMKSAIDRLDHRGEPLAAAQAITAKQALYAYTMGGAIASGDQHTRGSITPGKWADFAVLDRDPLKSPVAELGDIKVMETYVGGKLVYSA